MRIASVSKSITGVAIMQLAGKRKLNLDQPVFDLLKFDPMDPTTVDPDLKKITIRHLLHHTGGFDRQESYDPMFQAKKMVKALGKELPISHEDIIRYQMSQPLDFVPGEKFAYSNYGYCLLGRVIEEVTGDTYEDYVKANVLKPIGVRNMKIGKALERDRDEDETKYYLRIQTNFPCTVAPDIGKIVKRQYGVSDVSLMESHGGLSLIHI